jgi:hypothetical protein
MPERVEQTIFYSWQSDLKSGANRTLIEDALGLAVKELATQTSIVTPERDPALRVDQATAGVPGAPDIPATILAKIDQAIAVVADVSLINRSPARTSSYGGIRPIRMQRADQTSRATRPTPNPNVLVEVGYAMKSLGPENLILVVNTAYGRVAGIFGQGE